MLAHVLVKNSTPENSFQLKDLPLKPLEVGEVRIKVDAFGINYSDIMARQGLYRDAPPLPCVIGYDVEGTIDEVHDDQQQFKKGDRVFALTRFGGYAEYAVTQTKGVAHLPPNAPTGMGCALATQCVTAYHAAIICQTLMPGEKVMIHAAAGGLGTALVQIALWKRCIVIAVAGGNDKAAYLRQLGVQHVVDHYQVNYLDYVRQYLNGRVDVVFDNIGGSSIKKAKSILAPGGRIVTLGAAALSGKKGWFNLLRLGLGFGFFSPISYLSNSQSLLGVNMLRIADHRPDLLEASFKGVSQLYSDGILHPRIDKIFNKHQLADAHSYVEGRNTMGKVVVTWDD